METLDKASNLAHEATDKLAKATHRAADAFDEKSHKLKTAEQRLLKNCQSYPRLTTRWEIA